MAFRHAVATLRSASSPSSPARELGDGVGAERVEGLHLHTGMSRDPVEHVERALTQTWAAGHDDRQRKLVETMQQVQDELE